MVRASAGPGGWAPAARALVHSTAVANIKSQIKRNRQNVKRHERNKAERSSLKTATKKVHTAVAEGDAEAATAHLAEASRAYDKATSKGIVHKRTAARHKSRLAKAANRAVPSEPSEG
jgi:small subunit ribosomal protein S20